MPTAALLLIDFQIGFDEPVWGSRNNPGAEDMAQLLLRHWRIQQWPVFHVQHVSMEQGSPLASGRSGVAIKPELAPKPGEPLIQKNVNSAFIGTDLEARLRSERLTDLVICGLTTPHCVSTTARMAGNLGFATRVVHDACAAVTAGANVSWAEGLATPSAEQIHQAALSHLHGEFAQVVSAQSLMDSK